MPGPHSTSPQPHTQHVCRTQAHRIRVSLHRVLQSRRHRPRRMVRYARGHALRGACPFQEKIGSRQINITLTNSTCRLTAEFPHSRHPQETPPPHVPLIKKFIFGAAKPCGSLSAVHMYEGKENMEAVKV